MLDFFISGYRGTNEQFLNDLILNPVDLLSVS